MKEVEIRLSPTGAVAVRGADEALLTALEAYLGPGEGMDCGQCPPGAEGLVGGVQGLMVRIAGIVHESMVDGPGLRTVIFVQGCKRQCEGCRSVHLHDPEGRVTMTVEEVVAEALNPAFMRDGVTLSGGEPFLQPEALAAIATALKGEGQHVMAYTGYTYEDLLASGQPSVKEVLATVDVLVDGPFVAALRDTRSPFVGSSNQRVIDLAAMRKVSGAR